LSYQPLTDEQWEDIAWLLPVQETGRPRTRDRDVLNAILYVLHTGCRWAELPPQFPPKSTVHDRFKHWSHQGVFTKILSRLKRYLPTLETGHLDATVRLAKKGGMQSVKPGPKRAQKSICWSIKRAYPGP
jgi:transposase